MVRASTDGGRTFAAPVDVAEPIAQGGYQSRPAVAPDGVLHVIFPGGSFTPPVASGQPTPPAIVRPVFYRRSADNGRTWTDPVEIDPGSAGFSHNRKHLLAADPRSGTLYAVWYGIQNTRPALGEDTDIMMRVSRDGGATWSDVVIINDDASRPNVRHYDAGIASDDDAVYFAWQDSRHGDAVTNAEDVYFSALYLDGMEVLPGDEGSTVPAWILLGAGVAVGMGVSMLLVALLARRSERTPARVPT